MKSAKMFAILSSSTFLAALAAIAVVTVVVTGPALAEASDLECRAQGEFDVTLADGTIVEGECSFKWKERVDDRERATIECEVPDGTVGPNAAGTTRALRGSIVRAVGGAGGPSPGTRFVQCNLPTPAGGDELRCQGREEVRGVGADIHPDLTNTPIVIEVVEGSGNIELVNTTCVPE